MSLNKYREWATRGDEHCAPEDQNPSRCNPWTLYHHLLLFVLTKFFAPGDFRNGLNKGTYNNIYFIEIKFPVQNIEQTAPDPPTLTEGHKNIMIWNNLERGAF